MTGFGFADPEFLRDQARRVLAFYLPRCIDEDAGGFVTAFADDGAVLDPAGRHLVQQARYTLGFALGCRFGLLQGCAEAAEHGLAFLRGPQRDPVHGGWWWLLDGSTPVDRTKHAYGHAFVLLAAAEAVRAGLPARDLLEDAFGVLEERFWLHDDGLYADERSEDWTVLSPYRGQNANMHLCEALLAAHAATGEARFLDRAEEVARRVCLDLAGQTGGLLWEHYDADWRADLAYNRDRPDDMFRPWGVLSGHLMEWAKLLVVLHQAQPNPWAIPTTERFFAAATGRAWDAEFGGFLYSFALDGRIVDDRKYHWVTAEAIGAAAALSAATGNAAYRAWYDRCWAWALAHQIDNERGGWWPGLARDGSRLELPFAPGKPELYHPLGACLGPLEWLVVADNAAPAG
jgi:mannose/cellobiose epimerase-like protein (N-acyl-D-glucosamine 2-epimerase family)